MEAEQQQDGIIDDSEDDVALSMVDILEAEEKLQEDADAVLGGSDDRNCTYSLGYIDRQALYSCKTCTAASDGQLAGVCLACSLECHEGHELVELYTKRNFRCDCGNSKFHGLTCKLCPDKEPINLDNRYNHNYSGLYCCCSRPYPDPEDMVEDDMIQCVVCEDWFHKRHIGTCPIEDDFGEMICSSCMENCKFLWPYAKLCRAVSDKSHSKKTTEDEGCVDVVGDDSMSCSTSGDHIVCDGAKASPSFRPSIASADLSSESLHEASGLTVESCRLEELGANSCLDMRGAVFWPEDWRNQLCRCARCSAMYKALNVLFLLDNNDTISAYEERGKSKASKTSYQQGMEALSRLDHVQQVDLIQEYNDLKSNLTEYLKKFAENKKVVRQEDVDEFFTQLAARKRQKVDGGSVQHFCK